MSCCDRAMATQADQALIWALAVYALGGAGIDDRCDGLSPITRGSNPGLFGLDGQGVS